MTENAHSHLLRIIGLALLLAMLLSSLSLVNVSSNNNVSEENRHYYTVTGTQIICDTSRGTGKNMCIGEYTRGWPVGYGEGSVVLSTDGRENARFTIDFFGAMANILAWLPLSTFVVYGIHHYAHTRN